MLKQDLACTPATQWRCQSVLLGTHAIYRLLCRCCCYCCCLGDNKHLTFYHGSECYSIDFKSLHILLVKFKLPPVHDQYIPVLSKGPQNSTCAVLQVELVCPLSPGHAEHSSMSPFKNICLPCYQKLTPFTNTSRGTEPSPDPQGTKQQPGWHLRSPEGAGQACPQQHTTRNRHSTFYSYPVCAELHTDHSHAVQGTAATALAGIYGALKIQGKPAYSLTQRCIAFVVAGSVGLYITPCPCSSQSATFTCCAGHSGNSPGWHLWSPKGAGQARPQPHPATHCGAWSWQCRHGSLHYDCPGHGQTCKLLLAATQLGITHCFPVGR